MSDEKEPGEGASDQQQPPAQKTDEEVADRLYDPVKMYATALQPAFDRHRDASGLTEEEIKTELEQQARFFVDAQVSPSEAGAINSLMVKHHIEPAASWTKKEWATESRKQMRETYGKGATARLAAVDSYIDRFPGLRDSLTRSGVASHPTFVLAMAERAYKFRSRGAK